MTSSSIEGNACHWCKSQDGLTVDVKLHFFVICISVQVSRRGRPRKKKALVKFDISTLTDLPDGYVSFTSFIPFHFFFFLFTCFFYSFVFVSGSFSSNCGGGMFPKYIFFW